MVSASLDVPGVAALPFLLLKLTLAPSLVAGASLVGRRFGPRVGGWVIGFPVVAGPVLGFYAHEQGPAFATQAASGTLLGGLSLCAFMLIYAWAARTLGWLPSVLLGWLGFTGATFLLAHARLATEASLLIRLLAVWAALGITMRALPRLPPGPAARRPRHDLALRMLVTAVLVVSLTGVAHLLGPALSGLLTPFPVATSVLVVFAHREAGAPGVLAVYGGFIPSLYSFASFCAALSFGLGRWSVPAAFAAALLVTLAAQTVVLEAVRRRDGRRARAA
jgi:hypothetical protein